jgi:hypothetical protein
VKVSGRPLIAGVSARDQECVERRRAKINQHGAVSAALTRWRKGKIIPLRCSRGQVRANDADAQVLQFGPFDEERHRQQPSEQRCQGAPAGCRSVSTKRQREVQRSAKRTVAPLPSRVHPRDQLRRASFVEIISWRDGAERWVASGCVSFGNVSGARSNSELQRTVTGRNEARVLRARL